VYALTGDFLASDPRRIYEPNAVEAIRGLVLRGRATLPAAF
jgi:hypothetical protein